MYRDKTRDEERFTETSWTHAKVTMADVNAVAAPTTSSRLREADASLMAISQASQLL